MEELMWGHVSTEPEEEEDEEAEEEEEVVGSRVVARCSFSGSMSMESRRTWAVLRGCRSFCTAAEEEEQVLHRATLISRLRFDLLTHRLCSCPPADTS